MSSLKYIYIIALSIFYSSLSAQNISFIDESEVEQELELGAQLYEIDSTLSYIYAKPAPFSFAKNAWKDLYEVPKAFWKKESIVPTAIVIGSTALLMAYDDKIYNSIRHFSDRIGLAPSNNTINISPSERVPINVPSDVPSGLYYIGDGITELGVTAGFYAFGLIAKDNRARRVSSQLFEGMIAVGIYVQVLKHLTMHETPERRSMPEYPRGRWKFFNVRDPLGSIQEYHSSVPSHDAWPSGHLSIAMMTTTVISLNYPEKKWIKPICYTLMGLCGYQMVNNGVHWASDYPFAIGMGYLFGKVIVNRGRKQVTREKQQASMLGIGPKRIEPKWSFNLAYLAPGVSGARLSLRW